MPTIQPDRRATRRLHSERGAVAVWTATGLIAFFLALGIGVDFSGHARAEQELRTLAREAARVGTQEAQIVVGTSGLNISKAVHAANGYLHEAGQTGTAQAIGPRKLRVTVAGNYECAFLNIIGIHTLPVTAHAQAQLTPAFVGSPR